MSVASDRRGTRTLVPGTPVDGRYRVARVLGHWSIGTAYLAHEHPASVERALFVLPIAKGRDAAWLDWMRAELARVKQVKAPGLLAPLAGGHAAGIGGYIVVDRPRGGSLQQVVKKDGPMAGERAVALVERLARIVSSAHAGGLVLGDVRPSTVLMPGEGDDDVALLDLGLARGLSGYLAQPPDPSPAFTSPARRAGTPPTIPDDVYALGALLFFVVTGVVPTVDADEGRRVVTPPSWVRPDLHVSPYIDPVVLRAMSPRPEDRYRDMNEMVEALAGVREVFALPPAARELLGLPGGEGPFRREPTSPYLLHDMLGVPEGPPPFKGPFDTGDHQTLEIDASELEPTE
jgi:serine/threonine protein kinase